MVARKDIARIVSGYENPRIGVLGSHSALEIMDGAKDENFQTSGVLSKRTRGSIQKILKNS